MHVLMYRNRYLGIQKKPRPVKRVAQEEEETVTVDVKEINQSRGE
jgi:hypothetical protein